MTAAPKPDITIGEPRTIGRPTCRSTVRLVTIRTGHRARWFWQSLDGNTLFGDCGRCSAENPGTRPENMNVLAGVCFGCEGSGLGDVIPGGIETAVRRERANWHADVRRQAEADAIAARVLADGAAWQVQHADLVARVAELTLDEAMWVGEWQHLYELGCKVQRTNPLTDKETAYLLQLLDEYDAEQARRARQRYAGELDQPLRVAGVVAVAVPIENRFGMSMLVVVEGTGADEGITVKVFSNARAAWDLDKGDAVTITGVVSQHAKYEGTPQTVLRRPKFTAAAVA